VDERREQDSAEEQHQKRSAHGAAMLDDLRGRHVYSAASAPPVLRQQKSVPA
jgi:hypothetical protein